jgi:hypothetical protein
MRTAALPALLFLAACGDDRSPSPTAEESAQLNEAEDLLNEHAQAENRVSADSD